MASKSYQIGYNFQRRVVKHLKDQGFSCIVQPKSAFPDILAWRPFISANGDVLAINVQSNLAGTITNKTVMPFFVSFIECKVNKYLSKKEKEAAKLILKEGRCNTFLVAHRKKRKLLFYEITVDEEAIMTTPIPKELPSYVG